MATTELDDGNDFVCPECGKPLVISQAARRSINFDKKWLMAIGLGSAVTAGVVGLITVLKSGSVFKANSPDRSFIPTGTNVILKLAGSNTIGAKLAPALVEAYFSSKGCTDITKKTIELELIHVHCKLGGSDQLASISFKGTSTAFTSLKDGSANIGMASRRAKPAEVTSLAAMGNLLSPANEHVIALDGIAIIVNPVNQIPRLSIEQVRELFTGKANFFNLVGGINKPVNVYRRDDKSGTFDSFKSLVMGGLPITASAKVFEDGHELSSAVVGDPSGIGFVGHTQIGAARAVPIGAPGQRALLPNRFTIQTEDYPLSMRLYLYSLSESGNNETAKFISFVTSQAGQSVIEKQKFVPLAIVAQPSPITSLGNAEMFAAERLSVNFRFNSGSNQLDNKALIDLDRVTSYLSDNSINPNKLLLVGFADNVGDPASNLILSKERANAVASALKTRGITPGRILGFGAENPVASNNTPDGRERNRRVEVWVSR